MINTSMNVLSTKTRTSIAASPGSSGRLTPPLLSGAVLTPDVHVGLASGAGMEPLRQHAPVRGGRVTYVNALQFGSAVQAAWQGQRESRAAPGR